MSQLHAENPTRSVVRLCDLFSISRSWFYARQEQPTQAERDAETVARITALATRYPCYGYRRITPGLRTAEAVVNHKRVQRILQAYNLRIHSKPKRIATTVTAPANHVSPNRIRVRQATDRDQIWVADTTAFVIGRRPGFLACVLDAWSRRCLGWAVELHNTTNLTLAALRQAITLRHPAPGLIHHSDQGSPYTSFAYQEELHAIGAVSSMSAKARPTENAIAESFFKTIKTEVINRNEYQTLEEAVASLQTYIDGHYNLDRIHSSLGKRAPIQFEAAAHAVDPTRL